MAGGRSGRRLACGDGRESYRMNEWTRGRGKLHPICFGAGLLLGLALWAVTFPPHAGSQSGEKEPVSSARTGRSPVPRPVPHVTITPAMARYSHIRYALYFVDSLAGMLAIFLILQTGASARLRDLAEARARNGLLRATIYVPLYLLVYTLLMLPLSLYGSYLLPHQY